MGATPKGMGHHILLSVKMTLNARINLCFSAFLDQYIESFVLLEVARREATASIDPLNQPL